MSRLSLNSEVSGGELFVCGELVSVEVLNQTNLDTIDELAPMSRPYEVYTHLVFVSSENSSESLFALGGYETPPLFPSMSFIQRAPPLPTLPAHFLKTREFISFYCYETKELLNQISFPSLYSVNTLEALVLQDSASRHPIILTAGEGTGCLCYDFPSGEVLLKWEDVRSEIDDIHCFPEWSPHEVYVAGVDPDLASLLHRCDLQRDGILVGAYVDSGDEIISPPKVGTTAACLSEKILISATLEHGDEEVKFWSRDTYECIERIKLRETDSWVDYSNNSHLLCAGGVCRVDVWDVRNLSSRVRSMPNVGNPNWTQRLQSESIMSHLSSIPFSSLFVVSCDNYLSVFDPQSGKILQSREMDQAVYSVRALPSNEKRWAAEDEEERLQFIIRRFGMEGRLGVEHQGERLLVRLRLFSMMLFVSA